MRPNILNCAELCIELVGSKLTFYFGLQDRRELPVEINGILRRGGCCGGILEDDTRRQNPSLICFPFYFILFSNLSSLFYNRYVYQINSRV